MQGLLTASKRKRGAAAQEVGMGPVARLSFRRAGDRGGGRGTEVADVEEGGGADEEGSEGETERWARMQSRAAVEAVAEAAAWAGIQPVLAARNAAARETIARTKAAKEAAAAAEVRAARSSRRRAAEKTRDAIQRTDEWTEQTAAAAGREGGEGETAGIGAEVAAAAAGPGVAAASRESAAPTAGSKRNREEVRGAQGGEGRETAGPSGSAEARAAPATPARGEQMVIGNKRAGKQRALRQQGVYIRGDTDREGHSLR